MFGFFGKAKREDPRPPLDDVDLDLVHISDSVEATDGLPRINWPSVREAVQCFADHPAIDHIWSALARQWLDLLREHLADSYQIYESNRLIFLSTQSAAESGRLLRIADEAYDRLEKLTQRSETERGLGKHVVLIMKTRKTYYDYIAYFYPEREQAYGTSSGIHISAGYRHTALNGASLQFHRTLVHELAHNMVCDRALPRWLDEGLAQFAEDMVPGCRTPLIDARDVRLQHRYWSWFGMDRFWNGKSFSSVGSQRLSYQLAEVLFRNLATDRKRTRHLGKFLLTASRKDSGAAACADCFGCSLNNLVEEFLGPGQWKKPAASSSAVDNKMHTDANQSRPSRREPS